MIRGDLTTMADNPQEEIILSKEVFPTGLRSEAIRFWWSKELRNKSLFSARTTSKEYLDRVKQLLADYQNQLGETESGQPITQGLDRTRMLMREKLEELGLIERDEEGNIVEGKMTNLGSSMRLNLIIKTNTELAHSMRQKMTAEDPLQKIIRPYFELVRNESRKQQRNWYDRWMTAVKLVNGEGVIAGTTRMIARTDSPIWSALGNAFPDSIGNDMPPFCWGSGMGWKSVTAKEIKELGLKEYGE